MKKRWIAVLISVCILSMGLTACGNSASDPEDQTSENTGTEETSAAKKDDKYIIGMALATYSDQWLSYMIDAMEEYAAEFSDEYEFKFSDAQNDSSIQLGQIEEFIAQEVDAIVVNPVETDSSGPVTDACKEAGIPVVSANRPFVNQDDAFSYCGGDSKKSGEILMEYLAELADYKGNVAIIQGVATQEAAVLRTEGIQEVVDKYPDMEVVFCQPGDWDRALAVKLTEDLIQSGQEFNIIAGECDELGVGACIALDSAGIEYGEGTDIIVGAIDGSPDGLDYIDQGKMVCSVFQDGVGQAQGSMDAAMAAARGEEYAAEQLIDYELVTPDLTAEYLAKWQ